jgi:hypothetical protein
MSKFNVRVDGTKIVTGKVRASYAHAFEPQSFSGKGDDLKYSVSLIIPKDDKAMIEAVNKAVAAAIEEGKKGVFKGKVPKSDKLPLKDGDTERATDEAYADAFYVSAISTSKPQVVNLKKERITDPEKFYSGCYCLASLNFYPFNFNGTVGVACGLNNILTLEEGDPLAGRSEATSDFADYFDDDADPLLG